MRRETHFSNSPVARGNDLIDDNGWRVKGDDVQRTVAATGWRQSWTVVVAERAERGFARREF